jgi:hypothetical protein
VNPFDEFLRNQRRTHEAMRRAFVGPVDLAQIRSAEEGLKNMVEAARLQPALRDLQESISVRNKLSTLVESASVRASLRELEKSVSLSDYAREMIERTSLQPVLRASSSAPSSASS